MDQRSVKSTSHITSSKIRQLASELEQRGIPTRMPLAKHTSGTLSLLKHPGWTVQIDWFGTVSVFHILEGTANARVLYELGDVKLSSRSWPGKAADKVLDQAERGFPKTGSPSNVVRFPPDKPIDAEDTMPSRPWKDDFRTAIYRGEELTDLVINSQGIILFAPGHPRAGQVVPHRKGKETRIHRLCDGTRHGNPNAVQIMAETFIGPPPDPSAKARLKNNRLWRTLNNVHWCIPNRKSRITEKSILWAIDAWGQGTSLKDIRSELNISDATARHAIRGHQWRRHKKNLREKLGDDMGYHPVNTGTPPSTRFDEARVRAIENRRRLEIADDALARQIKGRLEAQGMWGLPKATAAYREMMDKGSSEDRS